MELKKSLYSRGSCAHNVFSKYDINGDGYLSMDELTKCCGSVVPGGWGEPHYQYGTKP